LYGVFDGFEVLKADPADQQRQQAAVLVPKEVLGPAR
jgi:hypothetical protein